MFVAWRELAVARGRFALIGSVVTLITVLVGFLGGLTFGLANANISALTSLTANTIVFGSGDSADTSQEPTYASSQVTANELAMWRGAHGVEHAEPLGIATVKAFAANGDSSAITLFGVSSSFDSVGGSQQLPTSDDGIVLSAAAAKNLGALQGDDVTVAGTTFTVDAVNGNSEYSHTGVAYASLDNWRVIVGQQTGGGEQPFATVFAVTASGADLAKIDAEAGTTATGIWTSLLSLESFKSEIGSLGMMMALLFGISALVIGAFFTVWTLQRHGDVAVLKALGASTASLVKDALGQALAVLVAGVGLGLILTIGLGLLAASALPFVLSPLTTLLPAAIMIVLGLAGAAFALRSVTTVDPLAALSGRNS
ncbi:ABC transporter permease [Lysinibacter cavernae]|uniref:Putative ABC transport system permease protein n=1 Tax=Lysinibacter cavernae TaxID=1640652 RepID=A0A7X5QZC2_9MICO|nr:FtsX-like permease family protein [Lysinibacter cavernae]NIH52771.1 putative ABC transport system permease protein [Lysinibacter cavernae]